MPEATATVLPAGRHRRRSRRVRVTATLGTTAVVAAAALAAGAGGVHAATSTSVSFPGSVPHWAVSANDEGAPTDDPIVEAQVFLALPDFHAAEAEALAVSTPGSSSFRKYLTPSDWITRYSPTKAALAEIDGFIQNHGLTIIGVPNDREYVVFRGPESKVYATFGTTAHIYRYGGRELLAPASAPKAPADIAGLISGISLDQGSSLTKPSYIGTDGTRPGAKPVQRARAASSATTIPVADCSAYWGEKSVTLPAAYAGKTSFPTDICGYSTTQIASAYGLDSLTKNKIDGAGTTIAIVDAYASPTIVGDSQLIEAQTGSPVLSSKQFSDITPPTSTWDDEDLCGDPSGWQTEESIDVQIAHGIAPGSKLLYAGGIDCEGGLDLEVNRILDNHLATIITNSYGDAGEALSDNTLVGEESKEFQAAAEGIGLYYSSGDDGDESEDLGYVTPDYEASSPWVTAVGGTSLAVSKTNGYLFETGWGVTRDQVVQNSDGTLGYSDPLPGTMFRGGAGGGVSTNFDEPAYQHGVVPSSMADSSSGPGRVVPDISALADPYTGLLIGISPINDDSTLATDPFTTETFGGTSLASPLVAAEMALAQQSQKSDIGFANPAIYALAAANPGAFHDEAPFNPEKAVGFTNAAGSTFLATFNRDLSLTTAKGYDMVTGVGSAKVAALQDIGAGQ